MANQDWFGPLLMGAALGFILHKLPNGVISTLTKGALAGLSELNQKPIDTSYELALAEVKRLSLSEDADAPDSKVRDVLAALRYEIDVLLEKHAHQASKGKGL